MKSDLAGIRYVKVVRDCPYSTMLIKQGTEGRIVYDYDVHQDGKRIATFQRENGSIRYRLLDADGKQIRVPETIRVYIAMSRKDCDRILKAALEAGAIPSEEQLVKFRQQLEEKNIREREEARLADIRLRKQDKAEELYAIIQAIIETTLVPVELMSRINSVTTYVGDTE